MAHTKYVTVLAKAIFDNILAVKDDLELDEVYFGDQRLIPAATACVVMAGPKTTTLAGVAGPGGRVFRDMVVIIDVHRQIVANTLQTDAGTEAAERLKVEQLAEGVEDFIHQDVTVGGLIIHGFINSSEPADTMFTNSAFRTVRMMFMGRTKLNLSV